MYNQWQPTSPVPQFRKTYELFISHSWDYGVDRDGLQKLLVANFTTDEAFRDSSAPKEHPIHSMNDDDLIRELYDRIQKVGVLIVPAGVYVTHSKWIQIEMAIAQRLGVPILAVRKFGADRTSTVAMQGANYTVNWNGNSIVTAVRGLHA
jgi:hypothetical protein